MLGTLRIMLCQPLFEEILHLVRQAQQDVRRGARPRRHCGFENTFRLVIGDGWHDRCNHHTDRHARIREHAHHFQARLRRGRARLERALGICIERGQTDCDAREVVPRQVGKNVDIPCNQYTFGNDRHGVTSRRQHREDLARHCELALGRLIRVRVRAEHDRLADVARPRKLCLEHLADVGLVEQLRLEIET